MMNDVLNDKVIAIVWGLESGFSSNTPDENRDRWFNEHKSFIIRKDNNDRLAFTSLDAFMLEGTVIKPHHTEYWVTEPVKLVERNDNGSYRCYETKNGVRYHIYKKGTIEKF